MTPEERQLLTDLANKIAQTPAPQRDPEAEELIRTRIGSRPDALYLMTQTVVIQNLALDHAKQQIQELQQHAGQGPAGNPPTASAFVSPGLSSTASREPAPGPARAGAFGTPWPASPPANAPGPGGGPSFLHSAATTAAGLVAGALAFEGIRSLFGGSGFGGGMHGASFLGGTPASETIINNYETPEQSADDRRSDDTADPADSDDSTGADDDDSDQSGGDDGGDDSDSSDDASV
jgi:hypothetical protein